MGFLVGPKMLIKELRALRRLMVRHTPNNNQRAVALFLSLGYHDALIARLGRAYKERWQEMRDALALYLPDSSRMPSFGGSSYWVTGPKGLDSDALALEALEAGLIIEPGRIYFANNTKPSRHFRLGFSSIDSAMIMPGIKLLAELIDLHMAKKSSA
jgi:GntR family transcriptional regulator/MocR family aminotransferase